MIQLVQQVGQVAAAEATDPGPSDWLFSLVMGVVEGLTEFIPVSSTGHLIVTGAIFQREDPAFEIAIQVGAITAILLLYWRRLFHEVMAAFGRGTEPSGEGTDSAGGQRTNLLLLLVVAALPASIVGLLFKRRLVDLLFNNLTVGLALVIGGVLLLVLESWEKRRGLTEATALPLEKMTIRQAWWIGIFQVLALIPGTSRAGATIAGGMVMGFKRTAAAEFSFLVGLPILYGAAAVKLRDHPELFADSERLTELLIASFAAFVSALIVVRPFVRFLQRHTFVPFAWYRIFAGTLLLGFVYADLLPE